MATTLTVENSGHEAVRILKTRFYEPQYHPRYIISDRISFARFDYFILEAINQYKFISVGILLSAGNDICTYVG
jgi:hypothetical protein